MTGGRRFQVSEGFRRFQRVSGFKFQVSGGFRRFQRVSDADASFRFQEGRIKPVKHLKLFSTTN